MSWLFVISILLIIVGASFSILRDPQTIDYCRTIVRDGRKDDYARNIMAMHTAGLVMMSVGLLLLIASVILVLEH
jgi:hypothetical protein